jgi:hypothetical protein
MLLKMDDYLAQLLSEFDHQADLNLDDLDSLDLPLDLDFLDNLDFDIDLDPPKLDYKLIIPPLRFKKKPKPAEPKPDIIFVER